MAARRAGGPEAAGSSPASLTKMKNYEYKCNHCGGVTDIRVLRDSEKATIPEIEFCPFCGMSNFYPKELEKKLDKIKVKHSSNG